MIKEIQDWIANPRLDSPLVDSICSSDAFSDLFEDLVGSIFVFERNRNLQLCDHVLRRIRQLHGPEASGHSQGFISIWRCFHIAVGQVEANSQWLENQISEAASVSLALVNSLWCIWGNHEESILRPEGHDRVRRHLNDVLRQQVITAETLEHVTHPTNPYVIYHLVFNCGRHHAAQIDLQRWTWMSSVLLAGLQSGQVTTAIGVCHLVAASYGSEVSSISANHEFIRVFFGDDALQVIEAIAQLLTQVDDKDQAFVSSIVNSARAGLAESMDTESE